MYNMGAAGLALQLAGLASGVVGSYWSAKSQKIQLQGQAELSDINARIAELGAQQELRKGQSEIAQMTMRAGQVKASQRAAMAANGIDLGVGSAAEVQATTDLTKEIDKNTIEANAMRAAWGYRTQAMNYGNEAFAQRTTASTISPAFSGFNTLLGGAGQVASGWYAMNKSGAVNPGGSTLTAPG
jgi:hypothetical protein